VLLLSAAQVQAFCGFYVAKADTKLFNKASKVVLVRHDNKTVITMANDFQGDPTEFAIVIPVPTFIERGQIHVTNNAVIDHLDVYSSPRLVEYFDPNPCDVGRLRREADMAFKSALPSANQVMRDDALGITVEAQYTVGEYDIVILSAEQSSGLEIWLNANGYKIPDGAEAVLESYIKQKVRFFVAKVNLKEQSKLGFSYLRPIQVAFETPKFMLPIRLGTVNANGPQDLYVFAITKGGRVETTNYRTVKLPSNMDVPVFVKDTFPSFYSDMFAYQVEKDDMRNVYLEYAWNMNWCDPCASDPLSRDELRELGVFWLDGDGRGGSKAAAQQAFVTRLHVRYDAQHFPDDLRFQETGDQSNFQGRYVLRHAWQGSDNCEAVQAYRAQLETRHEQEAQTLATLTGWDINDIRRKMGLHPSGMSASKNWWDRLWNND
jgi:hypothetical protein